MPELTRDQHLAWCKQRALAYLPADPANAMASMLSDLTKHVGTREHPGRELARRCSTGRAIPPRSAGGSRDSTEAILGSASVSWIVVLNKQGAVKPGWNSSARPLGHFVAFNALSWPSPHRRYAHRPQPCHGRRRRGRDPGGAGDLQCERHREVCAGGEAHRKVWQMPSRKV